MLSLGASLGVCVCVFFYLLHAEYQNIQFNSKVRTSWSLKHSWVLVLRAGVQTGFRSCQGWGQGVILDG